MSRPCPNSSHLASVAHSSTTCPLASHVVLHNMAPGSFDSFVIINDPFPGLCFRLRYSRSFRCWALLRSSIGRLGAFLHISEFLKVDEEQGLGAPTRKGFRSRRSFENLFQRRFRGSESKRRREAAASARGGRARLRNLAPTAFLCRSTGRRNSDACFLNFPPD
jgi:hypothetical protein